jgi:death-on-curing protein
LSHPTSWRVRYCAHSPKHSARSFQTLAEKAASLLQGIVIAHPFMDGNKRIGFSAMMAFLHRNGMTAEGDQDDLYDFVIAVTTGELREVGDIAARLREIFAPHLDGR